MGNSNQKPSVTLNVKSRNGINIPPTLLPTAKPPRPFTSEDNFFERWTSWKEEFLMFTAMVNQGSSNRSRLADLMLNLMGPIGRTIFNTFVFSSPVETKDIDILIKKFDNYFVLGTMKRKPRETVYTYMKDPQTKTKQKDVKSEEAVIKKKILTEIDDNHREKMGNSNQKPSVTLNVKSRNGINIPPTLLPTAKPPRPFTSEDNFFERWTSWKEEFLMFTAMVNQGSSNRSRLADLMLNLMGPIGRTIFNTFVFSSPVETKDIDILIKKFDNYFVLGTMKRKPREIVYTYMKDPQTKTKQKDVKNEEAVIKKKILTEIDDNHREKMGNSNQKPSVKSNVKSRNGINIPPTLLPTAKPPRPFRSDDNFFETWTSWKEEFLTFTAMVNEDNSNKSRWADLMLNLMGPIGRTIFNTFVFSSPVESKDIDILIKKFDNYFVFGTMKRKPRENVHEYMKDLQTKTKQNGVKNEEAVIKKKILTEIDECKFTNAAKCFLPTFTFSNDFGKLTLKEIAFFWEMYNDHSLMKTCKKCGLDHSAGQCPAVGKFCERCNEFDHFRRRCPQIFIDKCNYCGGAHFIKKCPAYKETCTKCQKLNHFSWKCQPFVILSCRFCGSSHPAAKACCPAKDNVCSLCHNIGHVPSKCNRTSHQQK